MTTGSNPFDVFPVGVNYMPREHGCRLWSEWSEAHIERDFKQMNALGLNTVRTFLFWEDFQPLPEVISSEALSKFDAMLRIAHKYGLKLVPTFFTGHMSGENFDVPWRQGRDPYGDPFMLRAQVTFVRCFAKRYRGHETILGWDLANEQDSLAEPSSASAAWLWTHALYRELKAFDPAHPVTIGTHVSSLERDKLRFDLLTLDYCCTHPYPMYSTLIVDPLDSIRSTLYPGFTLKLTQCLGDRAVMLEEFGASTEMTSEELSARYYRSVLYSSLANNAIGALAWCFADYTTAEKPYKTATHEFGFGLVKTNGEPKKHAGVLTQFAKDVARIGYNDLIPEARKAAIVIPAYFYGADDVLLPAHSQVAYVRSLLSAFVLAKQANINVDFIRPDAIPDERSFASFPYDLLVLPSISVKGYLTARHAELLEAYVARGGALYCSYNGVAFPKLAELFGFEIESRAVPSPEVCLTAADASEPEIPDLTYQATPSKNLIVRECEHGGHALFYDQDENPAVIHNRHGKGVTLFVTYPIEYYLSFMRGASSDNCSYTLYETAGEALQRNIAYNAPFVESQLFNGPEERYVVFINHSNAHQAFSFELHPRPDTIERVAPTSAASTPYKGEGTINLEPNGYAIFKA